MNARVALAAAACCLVAVQRATRRRAAHRRFAVCHPRFRKRRTHRTPQPLPIPPVAPRIAEGDQYDRCMDMLADDPAGADALAVAWKAGGEAATQCHALAQIELGNPAAGADLLSASGRRQRRRAAEARAEVFGEAAQAWTMAGDDRAGAGRRHPGDRAGARRSGSCASPTPSPRWRCTRTARRSMTWTRCWPPIRNAPMRSACAPRRIEGAATWRRRYPISCTGLRAGPGQCGRAAGARHHPPASGRPRWRAARDWQKRGGFGAGYGGGGFGAAEFGAAGGGAGAARRLGGMCHPPQTPRRQFRARLNWRRGVPWGPTMLEVPPVLFTQPHQTSGNVERPKQ